jgi:uncharacterized protein
MVRVPELHLINFFTIREISSLIIVNNCFTYITFGKRPYKTLLKEEEMKIYIEGVEKPISKNIKKAYTFVSRLRGLMFTKKFPHGGIHIKPCNGIHTFFMKYPIDVLFLDKNGVILHARGNVALGKIITFPGCDSVLELPEGTNCHFGLREGLKMILKE